jgi:hypothetical protein
LPRFKKCPKVLNGEIKKIRNWKRGSGRAFGDSEFRFRDPGKNGCGMFKFMLLYNDGNFNFYFILGKSFLILLIIP